MTFFSARWYLALANLLLFVDVEHEVGVVGHLLDELSLDVHGGSGSMLENEFTLLVFTLLHFGVSLRVLQNLNLSVDSQMEAYLLIGRSFAQIVADNVEIILDHVTQRDGVCQLEQHVVDRTEVDILDAMFIHMLQHLFVLHLAVNGTIASWCQTDLPLALQNDLALVAEGWDTALGEEDDRVLVIAEVFVLLEIADDLVVVHFAGHEVPLDQGALFVVAFAG